MGGMASCEEARYLTLCAPDASAPRRFRSGHRRMNGPASAFYFPWTGFLPLSNQGWELSQEYASLSLSRSTSS